VIASAPFEWPADELPSDWVAGTAGFHGPPHMIDFIERELDTSLAAAEEGLPSEDRTSALIAVLLFVELVRGFVAAVRRSDARAGLRLLGPERSSLL